MIRMSTTGGSFRPLGGVLVVLGLGAFKQAAEQLAGCFGLLLGRAAPFQEILRRNFRAFWQGAIAPQWPSADCSQSMRETAV